MIYFYVIIIYVKLTSNFKKIDEINFFTTFILYNFFLYYQCVFYFFFFYCSM